MTDDDVVYYDKVEFERVYLRAKQSPLTLQPRDLLVLEAFGSSGLVDQAIDARRRAALALLPPAPPLQTKSVDRSAARARRVAKRGEAYGNALAKVLTPVLATYKADIVALKASNEDLRARVLELEAQLATEREPAPR